MDKDKQEQKDNQEEVLEEKIQEETENNDDVKEENNNKIDIQEYEKLEEKYNKVENSYQRLLADYENLKRRSANEVLDAKVKGKIEVVEKIIDIVDNFDRSMSFDAGTEEFKEGIQMLHKMFGERLKAIGLEEVRTEGELDPEIHQAIAVDNLEDVEDDIITEVLQKGYVVENKIIRPAMVKVNKKEN